ncbi:MAG: sensor histidine kinase KdpD [Steroidobacteraceae bacterium]
MNNARPDPDRLLAEVQAQEARAQRGKLKIFFGANAGVGKTFTMLEEAQRRKAEGVDVVVGYVEPHGRVETERLLQGLEQLPLLTDEQGLSGRSEFNLDAALRRSPQLLIIDELAHTNLSGIEPPRHEKRWQDVEEVLEAGIDVYTTVNVQHLESLNDVVAQITGTQQRETFPDRIFEQAYEVELIDLPPDDLLRRLRSGKVYTTDQAERAVESFFRKGNLIALRELALRKTADRVDRAMHEYRKERAVHRPWAARERLLVCIGPDEQAERLVRAGKRMADGLDAQWLVVYVETPDLLRLSEVERNRRIALMKLAESLGAETVTLGGSSAVTEILAYARTRNVTRILVGKPGRRNWRDGWRGSTTNKLIVEGGDFDVLVIGRDRRYDSATHPADRNVAPPSSKPRWQDYLAAIGATVGATVLCWLMFPAFERANLAMVYVLTASLVAFRYGRGPAILTSLLNVLAFDIVFVPPRYSLAITDAQYLLTFAIMLIVALIIGNLNASVRLQARVAGHRERRTALLYAMTRQLGTARDRKAIEHTAIGHVSEVFDCETTLLFPDSSGRVVLAKTRHSRDSLMSADLGAAQWAFDNVKPAGLGTDTLAGSSILYLPMSGTQRTFGVLAVKPQNPRRVMLPEQFRFLETFAAQIALALERIDLAEQAEAAKVRAESEAVRNSLLTSISHDLRTPLATVLGGASMLADHMDKLKSEERHTLALNVRSAARHVSEHVTSMLDLVRLESGAINLRLDRYALDDIVGTVLHRLNERLQSRRVLLDIPVSLPLLRVDGKLLEQVIENLIDNAIKYTHPQAEIQVQALPRNGEVEIVVADNGPGFEGMDPENLFQKFERGKKESAVDGIGLGLAICRAIVELHRGRIWAEERQPHGAALHFVLPTLLPEIEE